MGVSVQCQSRTVFPCRITQGNRAPVNSVIVAVGYKDIRSAYIHAQCRRNLYLDIIWLAFIFLSEWIYRNKAVKIIVSHHKADYRWNAKRKGPVFNRISQYGTQVPDSVPAKNQCIGIRSPLFDYRLESWSVSVRVCNNKGVGFFLLDKGKHVFFRPQNAALALFKATG